MSKKKIKLLKKNNNINIKQTIDRPSKFFFSKFSPLLIENDKGKSNLYKIEILTVYFTTEKNNNKFIQNIKKWKSVFLNKWSGVKGWSLDKLYPIKLTFWSWLRCFLNRSNRTIGNRTQLIRLNLVNIKNKLWWRPLDLVAQTILKWNKFKLNAQNKCEKNR